MLLLVLALAGYVAQAPATEDADRLTQIVQTPPAPSVPLPYGTIG
jgi:hypothetical protein